MEKKKSFTVTKNVRLKKYDNMIEIKERLHLLIKKIGLKKKKITP